MIPISKDLSVLNCGAGDMKFSFDPADPIEAARASRVVKDMLARGYMLFANVDGKMTRVLAFDETKGEYTIADGPEVAPTPAACDEPQVPALNQPKGKRGGYRKRQVPARGTPVTSVAPTSGG